MANDPILELAREVLDAVGEWEMLSNDYHSGRSVQPGKEIDYVAARLRSRLRQVGWDVQSKMHDIFDDGREETHWVSFGKLSADEPFLRDKDEERAVPVYTISEAPNE